jgi:hypothetical protein
MAYNEADMLPIWLRHYAGQVGAESCFVIDDGSTDGSTAALAGANRIRLPRSALDEERRAAFVADLCRGLLRYYDHVLYTDTDEIVVADPARHAGLLGYVAAGPPEVATALGLNLVHEPAPYDPALPILAQRRWCFAAAALCKPVLAARPVSWSPGFHSADAPVAFGDLFLFHLAYFDMNLTLRRQEKRRQTEKKDATTTAHHRVDDATLRGWMENWAALPRDAAVALGPDCPHRAAFEARVLASAAARAGEVYRVDLSLAHDRLWRVPARFGGVF